MTLPDERTRAVYYTQSFLRRLLDPKATPKVPRAIRLEARRLLKHYPQLFELNQIARLDQDVFAELDKEKV